MPMLVGLGATILVGLRLWLGMPRAFGEVLWAEDGLFAACALNHGMACTWEPYAGYFLFLPRIAGLFVAQLPLLWWPLASIAIAALVTGVLAAASFIFLRNLGVSRFTSVFAALLFTLLPISGVEVLAVYASLYVPLLITSALAVVLLPRSSIHRWPVFVLLLITALTMPAALAFVPFIVVNLVWKRLDRGTGLVWLGSLALGLAVQLIAALSATVPRSTNLSITAVGDWTRGLLASLLTTIPGLNVNTFELQPFAWIQPSPGLSWLVVGSLMIVALVVLVRFTVRTRGLVPPEVAGLRQTIWAELVLIAGVLALIPSVSGTFSFRYVVAPAALILIGFLILADSWMATRSPVTPLLLIGVLVILWWPTLPTSGLRSDPGPLWSDTVDTAVEVCSRVDTDFAPVEFAPGGWPNWPSDGDSDSDGDGVGAELAEPLPVLTQPQLRCSAVLAGKLRE